LCNKNGAEGGGCGIVSINGREGEALEINVRNETVKMYDGSTRKNKVKNELRGVVVMLIKNKFAEY